MLALFTKLIKDSMEILTKMKQNKVYSWIYSWGPQFVDYQTFSGSLNIISWITGLSNHTFLDRRLRTLLIIYIRWWRRKFAGKNNPRNLRTQWPPPTNNDDFTILLKQSHGLWPWDLEPMFMLFGKSKILLKQFLVTYVDKLSAWEDGEVFVKVQQYMYLQFNFCSLPRSDTVLFRLDADVCFLDTDRWLVGGIIRNLLF